MTLTFGEQESPNACQVCHQQKTAKWVQQALAVWKGPTKPQLTGNNRAPQAPTAHRAGF